MRRGIMKGLFAALMASFLSLGTIGLSAFAIKEAASFGEDIGNASKTGDPVCFTFPTSDDSTKTYYLSVKKALDVTSSSSANETIVIIPGRNPTLSANATVAEGDRLVLPMDSSILTLRSADTDDSKNTSYINYQVCSNNDCYWSDNYTKSTFTIAANKTLTVKGTLDIGGAIGGSSSNSNQRPCSYTNTETTKVILGKNAGIDVFGSLDCYGFITQETYGNGGLVTIEKDASAIEPMSIYDFGGAGDALYRYNYYSVLLSLYSTENGLEATCPFNVWSIHNIASLKIKSGGTLCGDCLISTTSSGSLYYFPNKLTLVSSSSGSGVFTMGDGGIISILVNPNDKFALGSGSVIQNLPRVSFTLSGGSAALNSATVSIEAISTSVSFKLSNVLLPISGNIAISLSSASLECSSQGFKLLPGAKIEIDSSSTMTIGKRSVVYTVFNNSDSSSTGQSFDYQNEDFKKIYPYSDTNTGTFINNGTLNVNAEFAGYIKTTQSGAKIVVGSSVSTSVTTYEFFKSGLSGDNGKVNAKIVEYLRSPLFSDLSASSTGILSSGKTYVSAVDSSSNYGFGTESATIAISGSDSLSLDGGNQTYTLSTSTLIGDTVAWTSSESGIFTVSGDGLSASVTPVSEGTATLAASVYNGGTLIKSVSKEISIKGNSINVIIKDTEGNTVSSVSSDGSLSYPADVSKYVTTIVDGACTNAYSFPDSKDLRTVTSWNIYLNGTLSTTSTSTSTITVSASSGDTFTIEPAKYTSTTFYLAYMTEHASNGSSSLTTSYALDENNKASSSSATLDDKGKYCYIESEKTYTLSATGSNYAINNGFTTSITDGTNTLTASKGSWGQATTESGNYTIGTSYILVSSSNG